MSESLRGKVATGAVWMTATKILSQAVSFVVSMVLARLLTPDDYGTVAMTVIFFAVASVMVESGFGLALIQKKDVDDLDYDTVFVVSLSISIVLALGLCAGAPAIASFYRTPGLERIIWLMSVSLLIGALNSVQSAELQKRLLFPAQCKISIVASLVGAMVGVGLALFGYGVWALVWNGLSGTIVTVLCNWFVVSWRPRLRFRMDRFKPLFSFGWKLALCGVFDKVYCEMYGFLIGRLYTRADLAYVNRGQSLPSAVMTSIDSSMSVVSFPALVTMQDDREKMREAMRKMIQLSTFFIFPAMALAAVCSKSLVLICYGVQWVNAVPFMVFACFSLSLRPINTINIRAIQAVGRSDLYFKLEVLKKVLGFAVMIAAAKFGVLWFMAASAFVIGPLSLLINLSPSKKLMGYRVRDQLCDVLPTLAMTGVMALIVFAVGCFFPEGSTVVLSVEVFVQAIIGGVVYLALVMMFKTAAYREALAMLEMLQERNPIARFVFRFVKRSVS